MNAIGASPILLAHKSRGVVEDEHAPDREPMRIGPFTISFFEWCYWIGLAIYGLAFGAWGLLGLLGQGIIIASIFGVTGIPPTENQALRSKGEAYRAYQARVSRFIPMPPRA